MVDISAPTYVNPAEAITYQMFGAEHLGGESIRRVIPNLQTVGVTHLRWPGGIPAEDKVDGSGAYIYDLTSIDIMTWERNGGTAATFSEVLDSVVQNGMSLSMLAPTARYAKEMHDNGLTVAPQDAYDDMYGFLSRLYSFDSITGLNEFGIGESEMPELTIEIGSEYYATDQWEAAVENGMDPADIAEDFGLIFAQIAKAIADFESANGVEVNTAVQAGRFQGSGDYGTAADNQVFIRAFEDAGALDAIDSVIWHRYTDNFDQTGHGITGTINGTDLDAILGEWEVATGNGDLNLVAGWLGPDVRSQSELDANGDNPYWGAKSLTAILQQFSILAGAGMDMGTIYSLGSNGNYGTLSLRDDIFLGGQLYQMMIEALPGTFLHEGYEDNTFIGLTGGVGYNQYHFSNEYKIVSFIAAKDLDLALGSVAATLEYSEGIVDVSGVRLFDPGEIDIISSENYTEIGVVGTLEVISPSLSEVTNGVTFAFEHKYEVVRLVMYREDVSIDETFSLADHSQKIKTLTLLGDENIDGFGNDISNVLTGNSGNNLLDGHNGDDTLIGGQGNDELVGGEGRDILWGGSGADHFIFGEGDFASVVAPGSTDLATLMGLDIIQDFEIGADTIMIRDDKGLIGVKDLTIWEVYIDGDMHFAVQIDETQETLLVNVAEHVSIDEFMNPENFLSDLLVCELPLPELFL